MVADALSRVGHYFGLQAVSAVVPIWIQEIANSYVVDPVALDLLAELVVHSPNSQEYSLVDGIIRLKKKIWVGANSALHT